jgi:hypothetical protein
MPPSMRWNRRDDNEAALVAVAEKLGAFWVESPPLDGWLYHARTGWVPVEIKQPHREGYASEFTKAQKRFFAWCIANKARWLVWRTEEDVLRDLNARK